MLRGSALAAIAAVLLMSCTAAEAATPSAGSSAGGKLHVAVQVNRFAVHGKTTTAQGTITANLSDIEGHRTTFRSPVTLHVARGSSCQILNLQLDQLTLALLGLDVHLNKVVLTVTGQAHGGVLGSLFCKLANARAASAKRAVVVSLNKGLRHHA